MKRLDFLIFLPILLLALDSSKASLLARGRPKTKKNEDKGRELPYICLEVQDKLPECNFRAEVRDEKPSRRLRSLDSLEEPQELSPITETQVTRRTTTIIYKIEGCRPSRLPFVLPLCKKEDTLGRILEVRRLYPFQVTDSSAPNTLVFPEVDMNQWDRFMQGPWIRPTNNEDDATAQMKKVTEEFSNDKNIEIPTKKTTKRKKPNANEKKNIQKKMKLPSNEIEENEISSKFSSSSATKQQVENVHQRDTNSYKTRSNILNRIVDNSKKNREIDRKIVRNGFATQQLHEFPYDEAIPYDPEKLRVAKSVSKFFYDTENPQIFDDSKSLKITQADYFFPYTRAIPYNPENLRMANIGSEFPYSKAIPFDSEKLKAARIGSEFPYSRAIPYDATKLRVAKRGIEYPYTQAIPYDPMKLEKRRNLASDNHGSSSSSSRDHKVHDVRTKPQNSRVVPFDTRMLDAAKDGGIFPYGKAIPVDTSKIVDTMKFSRSSVAEKIEIPVRHVKTFWDEDSSNYERKLSSRKNEMRLESHPLAREIQENLLTSWNNEVQNYDSPLHTRVARRIMESDLSNDISSINDSHEIPEIWSEFPYSKAIPFDPEKLVQPESLMENNSNPSIAIPQNFPYAKAIPYDPWKLLGFRRKKYESQVDATMLK